MKRIIIPACAGIGNTVLMTPMLLELKRLLPDCQRVIAGVPPYINLLHVPQLSDEIIPVTGIIYFRDIIRKGCWKLIRHYDYALIPYSEPHHFLNFLRKAGFIKNVTGIGTPGDAFFSTLLPRMDFISERQQNLKILEALDLPVNNQAQSDLFISCDERKAIIPILQEYGLFHKPFLVIHLSWRTTTERKAFPAKLLEEILQNLPASIPKAVLCGKEEKAAVHRFFTHRNHDVKLIDNIHDIRLLAAFLSYCRVMLSVDSGPMHLAAATGRNVIALFGPTEKLRCAPDGLPNVKIIEKKMPHNCNGCLQRNEPCLFDRECLTGLDAGIIIKNILSFF